MPCIFLVYMYTRMRVYAYTRIGVYAYIVRVYGMYASYSRTVRQQDSVTVGQYVGRTVSQ